MSATEGSDAALETETDTDEEDDGTEAADQDGETDTGDGDGDSGDGDGDSGDGDGDSGDGDGDSGDGDGDSGDGDGDTGDGDGDGDGDPLDDIPPEEWEPVPNPDGVPGFIPGVYDDLGVADPNDELRSLIGLSLRNRPALYDFLDEIADPSGDIFGQYMSTEEFMEEHAPLASDVELLAAWLEFVGFDVQNIATSGMLIHYHGTVATFNEAYNTELHVCQRKNPQVGQPPFEVYCTEDSMTLPIFVADRSPGVVSVDRPAATEPMSPEGGQILAQPPNNLNWGLSPARAAAIYDVDVLWNQGYDGTGQTIAVITGTRPHFTWLQTFWQSFGIVRPSPTIVDLLEPPSIRAIEATLNPAWAGAMAPGAEIIQYAGPDTRNSSTIYVYNEAIARMPGDGASILTTSLAHREDSEPQVVRDAFDDAAAMGAATGLTLMSASGNSGKPDVPSSSPYSLAVGGTRVYSDNQGNVQNEVSWSGSGSGITKSFPRPPWQDEVAGDFTVYAVVVDLALAAGPFIGSAYWIYWLNDWALYGGTSFASPAFSGMCAVMNQYRAENGLPPLGFMAPKLYWVDEVHDLGFRDVTTGGTADFDAGPGWDVPSGWGAPRVDVLAELIP